jgi:hypothetical protein
VPAINLLEVIGEKLRATAQRTRVRDIFDLFLLAGRPFDRNTVRRIAIMKCWEARYAFEPAAFLAALPTRRYDWSDLGRLVRPDQVVPPGTVIQSVQRAYAFLNEMTDEEATLAADRYGREVELHSRFARDLRSLPRLMPGV